MAAGSSRLGCRAGADGDWSTAYKAGASLVHCVQLKRLRTKRGREKKKKRNTGTRTKRKGPHVWNGERPKKIRLLLPEQEKHGMPRSCLPGSMVTCCLPSSDGGDGVSPPRARLVPQSCRKRKGKGAIEVRGVDDQGMESPVPPVTRRAVGGGWFCSCGRGVFHAK
jgi:hypothetical protein